MAKRSLANGAAAPWPWLLAFAIALLHGTPAWAGVPSRVRGVVTGLTAGSITVKEPSKATVSLKTDADTTYAFVVPSRLAAIGVGDFIGSAVKGLPNDLIAVEAAIIPETMRAGRIGYYDWDPLPDPTAPPGGIGTGTTKDTVAAASPAAQTMTDTKMTNGIVSQAESGTAGRKLTVIPIGGGKALGITVPGNAPVVRYVLADRSAVALGSDVVIKTNPGGRAGLITIGKNVVPPM
jgi:hypothetical protein